MLWFFVGVGILAIMIAVLQFLTWKNNRDAEEEGRLQRREELRKRENSPLMYSDKALEKHFSVRLDAVRESLATIDRIDFVGARDVSNEIKQNIALIARKLQDENFNSFIRANPRKLEKALDLLDERLKASEEAGSVLADAIVVQELGNGNEVQDAVRRAKEILSKLQSDDSAEQRSDDPDAEINEALWKLSGSEPQKTYPEDTMFRGRF